MSQLAIEDQDILINNIVNGWYHHTDLFTRYI